jgi:hypothetical protein
MLENCLFCGIIKCMRLLPKASGRASWSLLPTKKSNEQTNDRLRGRTSVCLEVGSYVTASDAKVEDARCNIGWNVCGPQEIELYIVGLIDTMKILAKHIDINTLRMEAHKARGLITLAPLRTV